VREWIEAGSNEDAAMRLLKLPDIIEAAKRAQHQKNDK
jgi:hypothetical protein